MKIISYVCVILCSMHMQFVVLILSSRKTCVKMWPFYLLFQWVDFWCMTAAPLVILLCIYISSKNCRFLILLSYVSCLKITYNLKHNINCNCVSEMTHIWNEDIHKLKKMYCDIHKLISYSKSSCGNGDRKVFLKILCQILKKYIAIHYLKSRLDWDVIFQEIQYITFFKSGKDCGVRI